ncbi:MAG TPA: hypothetical protein VGG19_16845 [Tepidisphaeraceae bacterium]|jgi:DNA-3-methyladenine glycosylase II
MPLSHKSASRSLTAKKPDIESLLSNADSKLGRVIAAVMQKTGPLRITPSKATPFQALVRAVIYQQLAGSAAKAIHQRLQGAIPGPLTPQKILILTPAKMRAAGLSKSKARYVRNLAEWFSTHPKVAKSITKMSDEKVIETLTEIAGVGVWTANVFLIFTLARLDVVPASDYGIRRAVQLAYGLKEIATPAFVNEVAIRWRPYRSIASMYLWQSRRLKITTRDLTK